MNFTYSFIHLDHLMGYNKPSKWPAASWPVSSIGRALRGYRGGSCAFRKRALLIFELLSSVSIKKKEKCDPGSNPDLSYPNLSALLLHYHTPPAKIPKNLSAQTSKLSFLPDTSITGDRSPFHNFWCLLNSTCASTSLFLRLIEKRIICRILS